MRYLLNCQFRVAKPNSHPAAAEPRHCQIRIEHERPINKGGTGVEIAEKTTEREPAPTERDRVIFGQLCRAPGHPSGFGDLLHAVYHRGLCIAPDVAKTCHAVGRGEVWVEFDSP